MVAADLMMVDLMVVILVIKNRTNVYFNFFYETNVIIMSRMRDKNRTQKYVFSQEQRYFLTDGSLKSE